MSGIPINSGTGPSVAATLVGTDYIQIVSVTGGITATAPSANPLFVTGSVAVGVTSLTATTGSFTIISMTTGTVNVVNVLSASGVTVASLATGTVTVVGTVAVSGGGGGAQYSAGATDMGATATGSIIIGVQTGATTGRAIAVTATGAQYVVFPSVQSVTAANITIASITTGTVTVVGTVAVSGGGGGVQYSIGDTSMAATGTGTLVLGMQTGATTGRAIALTTTGAVYTVFPSAQIVTAANVTIASITTGTVSIVGTPAFTASGVTIASIATGTVSIVGTPAVTAANVTIASITTGTVSAGLLATTAVVGAFVSTAHSSRWDAFAVNTTSGASTIVKTSGAHTLYITDMILSVDVPARVDIFSAATTKMSVYLATKGGFTVSLQSPMVLNSAQSLTFTPSASGSSSLFAAGFTVT